MNFYCWDNSTFYSISMNWNIRFPEDSKIVKFSQISTRLGFQYQYQFSRSVMSDSLRPMNRSTPGFLSVTNCRSLPNPCPLSRWWPSNHLILCRPLLLPLIFPRIRVFSNESALRIRWRKYWSFSFNISPSNDLV